jgi:hypothetical protein
LTPGLERQAWKSLRDSHNRRPSTTAADENICQVCWRKERWQNGPTRRSPNLLNRNSPQRLRN